MPPRSYARASGALAGKTKLAIEFLTRETVQGTWGVVASVAEAFKICKPRFTLAHAASLETPTAADFPTCGEYLSTGGGGHGSDASAARQIIKRPVSIRSTSARSALWSRVACESDARAFMCSLVLGWWTRV